MTTSSLRTLRNFSSNYPGWHSREGSSFGEGNNGCWGKKNNSPVKFKIRKNRYKENKVDVKPMHPGAILKCAKKWQMKL